MALLSWADVAEFLILQVVIIGLFTFWNSASWS